MELIKKGPWTAEEDEVLINFVNKYGPRDWSSIRSMGLLPRTGKSCRLRWVNKLRPNLKIGCKFSAEEERVVIDLQGRFGNKWATIAGYLPGRTDNDVKNFWSSRQKRLARILQSPPSSRHSSSNSQRNNKKGKSMAVVEIPILEAPETNSSQTKEESSSKHHQPCSSSTMGDPQLMKFQMPLPDLLTPNLAHIDSVLPSLDIMESDHHKNPPADQTPPPNTKLDLPLLLPETHDSVLGLSEEANFLATELENVPQMNLGSPFLELEVGIGRGESEKISIPDSFFDELPADMFDYLETYPTSSSSL